VSFPPIADLAADPRRVAALALDEVVGILDACAVEHGRLAQLERLAHARLRTLVSGVSAAADALLSVTEAAQRLGLARLPKDVPRVRRNRKWVRVRPRDLAQYLQNHVETAPHNLYSPLHDGIGTALDPASAAPDASRTRRDARGDRQHGRPVGTGRGRHLTAGRPVNAPAAPAVPQPPSEGEDVDGSD
jgi:hypothetical protein